MFYFPRIKAVSITAKCAQYSECTPHRMKHICEGRYIVCNIRSVNLWCDSKLVMLRVQFFYTWGMLQDKVYSNIPCNEIS